MDVRRATPEEEEQTRVAGGAWYPVARGDGSRSAILFCPGCGRMGSLTDHEIRADGLVTPSVQCGYNGTVVHGVVIVCPFHVDGVRLVGWVP